MKYVFGPVPSRRLGQSLGIDPIPLKTCNWNCVYCQLGRTLPLTNERKAYIPAECILEEVRQALDANPAGAIDWVTFVGSGEPTLHNGLGWLIRQVKGLTQLPIAVITNGALLYLPEVRAELASSDAVMPSLDAGNPRLYQKINRPWPKLTFDRLVEGLVTFRHEFSGKLWIEMMLIRGMNDTDEVLHEIATILKRIQPDQVHLLLPVRPPAESWVQPSDLSGMQKAQDILGAVACVVIPDSVLVATATAANIDNLETTILGIITRHPMSEEELYAELNRCAPDEIHNALETLLSTQKAQTIERFGKCFWSAAKSFYESEL